MPQVSRLYYPRRSGIALFDSAPLRVESRVNFNLSNNVNGRPANGVLLPHQSRILTGHHRVGHLDEPLGGLQRRRRSPHRSHRRHLTSVRGRSSIQPLPYHLAFNPNGLTNCSLLADENGLFAEIERGVPSPTLEAPLEVASAHRVGHGTASTYVSTF